MRYKSPFTLFKRRLKSGTFVWYYTVYDENGVRHFFSTGCTDKKQAAEICFNLFKNNALIPKKEFLACDYMRSFFCYDTSLYIQSKLARGLSYARTHADHMQRIVDTILIPKFGRYKLSEITTKLIESWILDLKKDNYSNASINNFFYALKTILSEAFRLGDITQNPATAIKPLANNYQVKGVFSKDEAKQLFEGNALCDIWDNNELYYLITKTASQTGMRMGELQALQKENVHEKYLEINRSWDRTYGLKCTKTGKDRSIPIQKELYEELSQLMRKQTKGNFVFSADGGKQPVDHKAIAKWHQRALAKIGIVEEERRNRHLSFHSWRHFVNTQLRLKGIPDSIVQAITGHSTQAMTERYTHYSVDDLCNAISDASE